MVARFIAGLSALALPGMSTFISEFLTLVGAFTRHKALAIVGTTGIILAALYVLLLYQRTMQGPLNEKIRGAASFKDLKAREIAAVAPLIVLILVLGIYPKPVIELSAASVAQLLENYERAIGAAKTAALLAH